MRTVIVIAADLLIAVIALFTSNEIFSLRRYQTFTVPYTDKMIRLQIIDADQREAVLREDRLSHMVGLILSLVACIMMARFLAWPSGLVVFAVVVVGAQIFVHPDMTETAATREGYFRMHKSSINPTRYAEMAPHLDEEESK